MNTALYLREQVPIVSYNVLGSPFLLLLSFGCAHGVRKVRKSDPKKINGLEPEKVVFQTLSLRQPLLRKLSLPGMAMAEIPSVRGPLWE